MPCRNSMNNCRDYFSLWKRLPDEKCLVPDSLLHRFQSGNGGVSAVAFSCSGELLAIAAVHRLSDIMYPLKLYDINKGEKIYSFLPGHHGKILDLAWSDRDEFLASASRDGTISVHRLILSNDKKKNDDFCKPHRGRVSVPFFSDMNHACFIQ